MYLQDEDKVSTTASILFAYYAKVCATCFDILYVNIRRVTRETNQVLELRCPHMDSYFSPLL
jgi:hypothetical protein